MLGLFSMLRFAFRSTLPGKMIQAVEAFAEASDLVVKRVQLSLIEEEQELDLNRAKKKWEAERYEVIETLRLYRITPEDLPHPEAFHWAVGEYIFKLSEWVQLWDWIGVKLHNATHAEKLQTGIDGLWLLEVGRRRAAHPKTRAEALRDEEQTST